MKGDDADPVAAPKPRAGRRRVAVEEERSGNRAALQQLSLDVEQVAGPRPQAEQRGGPTERRPLGNLG